MQEHIKGVPKMIARAHQLSTTFLRGAIKTIPQIPAKTVCQPMRGLTSNSCDNLNINSSRQRMREGIRLGWCKFCSSNLVIGKLLDLLLSSLHLLFQFTLLRCSGPLPSFQLRGEDQPCYYVTHSHYSYTLETR